MTISKNKGQISIKDIVSKLGPLLALFVLSIIMSFASDRFLTYDNITNVLKQASANCLVAAGMLFTLITAGVDLSVGANLALSICVIGVMLKKGITNPVILFTTCLLVGLAIGVLNGLLLTKLDLPHPFVSTLGMQNITRGLALFITAASPISGFPKSIQWVGYSTIKGFPVSFILVIVLFIAIHIFLNKTALGRNIYCVGGNIEASRLSGIKTDNVLIFVYAFSGVMAALAGIVILGRVNSAFPLAGEKYDTDAIASCIIGGASFTGGKGTIWGTLVGSILIAVIRNGLTLVGASSDLQQIVIGFVIILAVLIDVTREKLEERSRRLAAV